MNFISGLPIHERIVDIIYDVKSEVEHEGFLRHVNEIGNNVMVTCPIHKDGMEDKPSCGVTTTEMKRHDGSRMEAGTVNCFTCGYVASLPEFISNALGYNDRGKQGFKWLSRRYQYVAVEERKPVQIVRTAEAQMPVQYVPEEVLATYRYTHPYMYRRGLLDRFIEIFDIGYCTKTDSITFPIKDINGNCLFIQKRSVQGKRFENDTNASKATLYGIDVLQKNGAKSSELVIVESPIDVITLWQWGIPALGTMQAIPTQQQIELIDKLPAKLITLAQDNDKAGDVGATRMRDKLTKAVRRVQFPEHIGDVNEATKEEYEQMPKVVDFKSVRTLN